MEDLQPLFHDQLDQLDDGFTAAGLRIVEAMPRFIRGYLDADEEVIAASRALTDEVSAECETIEDVGFLLLARHQPVGRDLRRLVALLRMTVHVDRAAALLRHVCETLRLADPRELPPDVAAQLEELATSAGQVFGGGVDAWRSKDALAVNELDEADERVDVLQRTLLAAADAAAEQTADTVVLGVVTGLVGRYLERIADHGVEIARDTAFVGTGERVTLPSKVG